MATYFTDFSGDTIGVLPADWVQTNCTGVVSAEGLAVSVTTRFSTIFYTGLTVTGATEIYCQFETSAFSSSYLGFGSCLGDVELSDASNVSALFSSSGTTESTRTRIYEGSNNRASVNITSLPAATTIFNSLLQVSAPAVAGASYTAKAWFWAEGATAKTSADTPDLTYAGTFSHTHVDKPGLGLDVTSSTVTLLKFGAGTAGDPAPQDYALPADTNASIDFGITDLNFDAAAQTTSDANSAIGFDVNDITFGVYAEQSGAFVPRVLAFFGASIVDATFRVTSPYTSQGAANFRRLCLELGVDIPFISYASGGSTMTATAGQIAAIDSDLASAPHDIFGHCYGNDASTRGNYPDNWDSTDLSTYEALVDGVISSINASSAVVKLAANLTYRTNVSGSADINTDIIEPKLTAGLVQPFVDWFAASYNQAVVVGDYLQDGSLHPNDEGAKALHVPVLDAYIPAASVPQTDIEDQFIISFGDGSLTVPNVTRFTATGTQSLTTQRMVSGGSCTLSGGTGFGVGTGVVGTSYQFDATHRDFFPTTFYGSFAPIDAVISMPAWADRAVRVKVTGVRAATGRETNITINGETLQLDPNGVTSPRTVTFLTTMDGSGDLAINSAAVTEYSYLTSLSVDLLRESIDGASSAIALDLSDLIFSGAAEAANNSTASVSFDINDLVFSALAQATNNAAAAVSFDINDLVFNGSAEAKLTASGVIGFNIDDLIFNVNAGSTINTSASIGFDVSALVFSANSSIVTSSTTSVSFDISDLIFGVVADNQSTSGLIDNSLYLVEERLINAFIAGAPAIFGGRIKYPNAEFPTPNNLTWAQVFAPASFGPISTDASGCYEINQGQMVITLFCPRGTGTRLIGAAAHEVKQLFGADNFDDVTITSVVVSPAPEPSSSPWYGINIVISFQYEGHRS